MKWDWLAARISEKGFGTNAAFAKQIGWPASRISELIRNTPVNGGQIRRIPSKKIAIFAKTLDIEEKSLFDYNEDISQSVRFTDTSSTVSESYYDKEIIMLIYETVHTFLEEKQLHLKPRKEIELVFSLYDKIKNTPSSNRMAEIISITEILTENQLISA